MILRYLRAASPRLLGNVHRIRPTAPHLPTVFIASECTLQKLAQKHSHTPLYRTYEEMIRRQPPQFVTDSGDLQNILISIPKVTNWKRGETDGSAKLLGKKLEGLQDVESVFVLVIQTILMTLHPDYKSEQALQCLNQFGKTIKPAPLMASQEVIQAFPFSEQDTIKILDNSDFRVAVQLVKFKLNQTKGWSLKQDCRDDHVLQWVGSLFQPTIAEAIVQLSKSSQIPAIVVYDLLLRSPANELEFSSLLKIYGQWSEEVNLTDQEKLYYMRKMDNSDPSSLNRDLILPPVMSNLFHHALRYSPASVPQTVNKFLDANNTGSPLIRSQLAELLWQLSYDHSGRNSKTFSRYYKLAQSQLIKAVNKLTTSEDFDVDVTTLLAVSNLTFPRNFRKALNLYKEAQKRFDRWQLESFDIDGFERVIRCGSSQGAQSIDEIRALRKDYNIKFLCNSVLLLAFNSKNKNFVYGVISRLLSKTEPELLKDYPEIWNFVLAKLNYHSLLSDHVCQQLLDLYISKFEGSVWNHSVLDLLILNINDPQLLLSVSTRLPLDQFDDINLSKYISKLYKMAKMVGSRQQQQRKIAEISQPDQSQTAYTLIDHYADVMKPAKKGAPKHVSTGLSADQFIEMARKTYESATFKSNSLNSSYLLGESIIDPLQTYPKYMEMNRFTRLSTVTISSLFVALLRMKELSLYEKCQWGEDEPVDLVLDEFDTTVSSTYDDAGKIYPDDNLLGVYVKTLGEFKKMDRIYSFLDLLVDLKYPMKAELFKLYLCIVPVADRQELVTCLNEYHKRFETLRKCGSEYELKMVKKRMQPITAIGRFKEFVARLEFNWDVIRSWQW